ncbi:MAG: hypothetical protein PHZ26_04375 [Candidatus Gracilibacteria bacterium]|nr:hypothetical protein [Candidatus Gracilibacteria bacterium]MDD2908964.1 hypothetical protein [Candidatus Gracilibacteria bacterium]
METLNVLVLIKLVCSSTTGVCSTGTKTLDNNILCGATSRTWSCAGSNGGTTANYSKANIACAACILPNYLTVYDDCVDIYSLVAGTYLHGLSGNYSGECDSGTFKCNNGNWSCIGNEYTCGVDVY